MPIHGPHRHAWWQAAHGEMSIEIIICPIAVVPGRARPLFRLDYAQQVFARIAAPAKEVILP